MLRMAVTTRAETYDRLRRLLPEYGIEAAHLQVDERVLPLSPGESAWDTGAFDVGYVYPSRLMEGGAVDAMLPIPWINDRDAVLRSRNKAGVLAAVADAGLPVPRSLLVSNPVDDEAVVQAYETIGGPVVVKPNSTTRGVGVARATDVDSLLGIVDYLRLVHDFRATGDKAYLVQEFVPDARDLRVMVLDGQYAGAVERRGQADDETRWKHNVHRGANAVGVKADERSRELAEAVARVLDVPLLGVDLLLTDEGPIVSETNARPTIDDPEKYEPDFVDRLVDLIRSRA